MIRYVMAVTAAVAITAIVALPLGHELYARHTVWQQLGASMSQHDRAAFSEWTGTAHTFVLQLRQRCERTYGSEAEACEPYRTMAN